MPRNHRAEVAEAARRGRRVCSGEAGPRISRCGRKPHFFAVCSFSPRCARLSRICGGFERLGPADPRSALRKEPGTFTSSNRASILLTTFVSILRGAVAPFSVLPPGLCEDPGRWPGTLVTHRPFNSFQSVFGNRSRIRSCVRPGLFCKRHFRQQTGTAARGSRTRRRHTVSNGRTNFQLDLRAGLPLAPDLQLTANEFGALAHARQAKVSGAGLSLKHLRVDALSIVTNT